MENLRGGLGYPLLMVQEGNEFIYLVGRAASNGESCRCDCHTACFEVL